ncbi:hypothetical protein [Azonexus sp.]|uniref:hypothetical protein n=1 Tax=Azonexus sp. TaxID=1872668 RepID=UPI0027BAF627|nr:hypothetical protein [Azonexus sp.]
MSQQAAPVKKIQILGINMNTQPQLSEDTDQLFRAIGRVVVQFQLLELWVAEALSSKLSMTSETDRHLISAAMSYRQKVDLLFELYARHGQPSSSFNQVIAKKALVTAEEFRNRIVHSLWSVKGEPRQWVRTKANLRGRDGFVLRASPAQTTLLEEAASAMTRVRAWEEGNESALNEAIRLLSSQETDA